MPSPFADQLDIPPVAHRDTALTPEQLLCVVRGFSCVFWGIALSILLFSGVLNIRPFSTLRLPTHVLGVVIILLGAYWMRRPRALTARWSRRARTMMIAVFFQMYMIPFVAWWRLSPHVPFFGMNMVLLFVVTAWLLLTINRLAAEVGRVSQNETLFIEARMSGWSAVLLLSVPLLFLVLRAVYHFRQFGFSLDFDPLEFTLFWPSWINLLVLIPFLFTMAVAWEAKEMCLARMNAPMA